MNEELLRRNMMNAAMTDPLHSRSISGSSMLTGIGPAMISSAGAVSTQEIKTPRLQSVRIVNTKNGYIIFPDSGYGNAPPFDDSYVAKDLDDLKDVLARYYVEKKLT